MVEEDQQEYVISSEIDQIAFNNERVLNLIPV